MLPRYHSHMFKRHYEKVIAACCFLFIFANLGLASTAFSVHQPYLVALPGIGDTGGSLILSARTLTSLLAMLFVDRYYRLFDVRVGVFVACLLTCAGFIVYSIAAGTPIPGFPAVAANPSAATPLASAADLADAASATASLPLFIAGAVMVGLGYGLGGMVAMTYLANRWFATGVGTVIGFASMGSGVASIVMPLVVVRVIEASSLSTAFAVEGALAAFMGLIAVALLRNRPSDLGMEPYQAKQRRVRQRHEMLPAPAPERALLMASIAGVGTFCCCGITYMSMLATSSGFSTLFAATIVSVAGTALTISKFVTGELFDHLGAPRASAIMFALSGIGYALCCLAALGNPVLMVVGSAAMGAGFSLGTVGISVWSLDLSDPANRARQVKNFQVAYSLGGFIANTLPGIAKDLLGSYTVSYVAMLIVTALSAAVVLRFYRKFEKRPAHHGKR